jgi:FAD/FMN-containing dehydrogenase
MASTPKDVPVDDLRADLSGELITLDDPRYDDARTVFFKGVDRHPLAVARVADMEDVARVVSFAREGGLELAVRSGGHSYAGHGASEGGTGTETARAMAAETLKHVRRLMHTVY